MRPLLSALAATGLAALAVMGVSPLMAEPPEGWQLVFHDEFESGRLDAAKWNTTMAFAGIQGPRYHNRHYLSYTIDDDIIVGEGLLRLRTERRKVEGPEGPGQFDYTQGLVTSHDKFSFTYGYIEIRAKFPGGKGLWPCLWLMPQHQGWPPEFDIAEYYSTSRTMHHGLAHGPLASVQWDSTRDAEHAHEDGWHLYALEWMPGRAVWSVDCLPRKTIVADYVPNTPMYVVLSNSVSSRSGVSGEPDATTIFPNDLMIDYVRVYQPAALEKPVLVADNKASETKAPPMKKQDELLPNTDKSPAKDEKGTD